jgi:uncharacterized membrane protein
VFAALRIWQLLSPGPAFALLVLMAGITAFLAVVQSSRSLAILGIVGGFLAPILVSTGQGNHVVLFSYYLVLNAAILGIAWFRAWRELNLIGFVFTFAIGSLWGAQYYKPALFSSTEPFLVAHFFFYQFIAILYALRRPPDSAGPVDGMLVFGAPVIASFLQAMLVSDFEYGMAWSAVTLAVFYAATAWLLWRKGGDMLRLLTESYTALAVAFGTLAIPLAFDARWTSAAWALEGAALVWIGLRQGRALASVAGLALIVFSGVAFFIAGWADDTGPPVLNGNVLGGLMICFSALFAARQLDHSSVDRFKSLLTLAAMLWFVWGVAWWFGTGWAEIHDRVPYGDRQDVLLMFVAVSMLIALWLNSQRDWFRAAWLTPVFLPFMALHGLISLYPDDHYLMGLGWLAWPLAWGVQGVILKTRDRLEAPLRSLLHAGSLILLAFMIGIEVLWRVDVVASRAWSLAAAVSSLGLVALAVWQLRQRPTWPVPLHRNTYLAVSLALVGAQAIGLAILAMVRPGDPDPFAYVPVINPFDLALLFTLLLGWLSMAILTEARGLSLAVGDEGVERPYRWLLGITLFIMTTAALVRGVHFYTGVPWQSDDLFNSEVVQTSLSIYWGMLGFIGMIWGARSKRRLVWAIGASFMALVVVKLFLVDLGNTGTVERIISFIGIGLLLLVVGYFAPVPPRQKDSEQ